MALALHRAKIRCRLCPVCTEYVAEKTTTTAKVCNCVIRMASPDAIPLQLRHLGLSLSPDPHEPPLPQGQRCFLIKDKAAHTSSHRTAPHCTALCAVLLCLLPLLRLQVLSSLSSAWRRHSVPKYSAPASAPDPGASSTRSCPGISQTASRSPPSYGCALSRVPAPHRSLSIVSLRHRLRRARRAPPPEWRQIPPALSRLSHPIAIVPTRPLTPPNGAARPPGAHSCPPTTPKWRHTQTPTRP
jgi:hypothetical protein